MMHYHSLYTPTCYISVLIHVHGQRRREGGTVSVRLRVVDIKHSLVLDVNTILTNLLPLTLPPTAQDHTILARSRAEQLGN